MGNFGGIHTPFEIETKETLTGNIKPGSVQLLYAEGDREFDASSQMTLEEFASRNANGHFLVVMIKFSR